MLTSPTPAPAWTHATREHVFEPFFTTKEVGKGTGLGLATVYGIVKQLDGYIWVTSEPGRGATFTVFLPASEDRDASASGSVPHPRPSAGDRTRDRAGGRGRGGRAPPGDAHARRHGYRVVEAGTPVEGLALAESLGEPLRLVISDMVLPTMNGPEMVTRLRAIRPEARVLYMSGYAAEVLSRAGGLRPGDHLLEKPFAAHTLLRKVREVLDAA